LDERKEKDMNLRLSEKVTLSFLIAIASPGFAYSLETGKARVLNDRSAIIGGLLFFGISLLTSGGMIMKNKRFGPEEGLRGNYIKGEKAMIWGRVQLFFGAILVFLGLIAILH
jgi:hypothetical protein